MSWTSPGRHDPERLRVVGDHRTRPARLRDVLRSVAVAGEHVRRRSLALAGAAAWLGSRRQGHGEARWRPIGEQGALGRLGGARDHAQLTVAELCDVARSAGAHARPEPDLRCRCGRRDLGVAERLFEAAQRVAQLVLAEHLAHARAVRLAGRLGGDVEVDLHVALDRREAPRHARRLGVLAQVQFALGPTDVLDVRQHALQRAVALKQLARRLVADARDARDVVGGVPLQAVEVRDELRGDPVAIEHRLAVVDLRVGDAARGGHHLDQPLRVDQLEDVAVAADDHHWHRRAGPQRPLCERRDHVVGLVALDPHVGVPEGLHERFHRRPLLLEQVRAGAALGLVLGEQLRATRAARIPGNHGRRDPVLGDDLHEHRGEPEDRVGRLPRGGRDRLRQRVERAVDEARAVDQEQAPLRSARIARAPARRCGCRVRRHRPLTLRTVSEHRRAGPAGHGRRPRPGFLLTCPAA